MADQPSQYGIRKEHEPDVVQFADEGNPSEITHAAFVRAIYDGKLEHEASPRTGKWLFFIAEKYIDNTWENVKKAIEAGKLWYHAKASTAWRSKGAVYVICIYTYDYEDEADVMRIRGVLREMGFKRPTSYKTDAATQAGLYADNSEGEVTLYRA